MANIVSFLGCSVIAIALLPCELLIAFDGGLQRKHLPFKPRAARLRSGLDARRHCSLPPPTLRERRHRRLARRLVSRAPRRILTLTNHAQPPVSGRGLFVVESNALLPAFDQPGMKFGASIGHRSRLLHRVGFVPRLGLIQTFEHDQSRPLRRLARTWNGNGLPTTGKILGAELRKRWIDFIRPFLEERLVIDRDVGDQISGRLGLGVC